MAIIEIYDLTCNHKTNPVGIDDREPRLSWKLRSASRGVMQGAYRIQAAANERFEEPLAWDTGKIESGRSVLVPYEGAALQSRTRYFYRVKAWTQDGNESEWSVPSFFETAYYSEDEWAGADWISFELPADEQGNEPIAYLRKAFRTKGRIASARVYATALGAYKLYVNGQEADDTHMNPGWTTYEKRLQYQTYDVTGLLAEGENALGVMLGNGWYRSQIGWQPDSLYGGTRALLAKLHVRYEDGSEEIVGTDGSWKGSDGALRMSELYHGELYDARMEKRGWSSAAYDDTDWSSASPYSHTKSTLVAQENEPVRQVRELVPVSVHTTPRGETVIDFGQNMVGWVRFAVSEKAGTVVTLRHAEVLDKEGNFYTGNLRAAKQTVTYICSGDGQETFQPVFSFQGFRYVKVEGIPAERIAGRFAGCVLTSDLKPGGSFRCSDPLINKLAENIVWGQIGNFVDVPTDCPQRDERLGWTGDAQAFIRAATYNRNVAPFFAKWLKDLAADQQEDGGVPHVIPEVKVAGYNSAAWGDAAVICPWVVYERYGDERVLRDQFPSMKGWVEYIRAQGENEFLWNTGFHFGDWLGLDAKENSYVGATPRELIATAFYAYSTGIVAKAAKVLGLEKEAKEYSELRDRVASAFREEFVTPSGRVASPTQTAYAVALMFDLLEEKDRRQAADRFAKLIEESGAQLTTGFVGTPYLCHVLTRFGYGELAYKLLERREYPSWLYPVVRGATTIWEHWDGIKPDGSFWSDDMNSYNHYAYGAVGDWLFGSVAGIDADENEPGYRRIKLSPLPGGSLRHAEATLDSPYGEIRSAWKRLANGGIVYEMTVPANASADVVLPGAKLGSVLESGRPLETAEGVSDAAESADGLRFRLGSGAYRFELAPLAE
ncbi:alpha-L-rhamnosidase [Cohnella thailandensis]|uniref:alpha-L-rhamnosidase n=1 Tax=Cohnella thailandensis TaxID=557557 RepID=A0A841T2C7_9BACL|nr:alpha-L-rhamnosidase [Cohnella thailandensis]MBB6635241.1 family 78 glycoside hydrolase catalytic domain [Cohnella thailandensis]MBP1974291.1 alpha-L-rhamnosidase [Cohnella thailandensis]